MQQFNLKIDNILHERLKEIARYISYKEGRDYSVTQLIKDALHKVDLEVRAGKSYDEIFGGRK